LLLFFVVTATHICNTVNNTHCKKAKDYLVIFFKANCFKYVNAKDQFGSAGVEDEFCGRKVFFCTTSIISKQSATSHAGLDQNTVRHTLHTGNSTCVSFSWNVTRRFSKRWSLTAAKPDMILHIMPIRHLQNYPLK